MKGTLGMYKTKEEVMMMMMMITHLHGDNFLDMSHTCVT